MFKSGTQAYLDKLNKFVDLGRGRTPHDVVAIADSREIAEEVKQNIIDQIDFYDHNDTGRMENSIGVRKLPNGEFGVTAVHYAKYVNGYDREETGSGFIDDGVNQAILDFGLDVRNNLPNVVRS